MMMMMIMITIFFCMFSSSVSIDTLTVNKFIRDDSGDTIISPGGSFELGFFSPGDTGHRYIGIWYKNISTGVSVWVANREKPLFDRAGILTFNSSGFIVLQSSNGSIVWSSDPPPLTSSSSSSTHPSFAQLLDTGNLVVTDTVTNEYLWQSYDHPGDTFLPGMKYGLASGLNRYLTAWKSYVDPSPGYYDNRLDITGFPQIFEKNGSVTIFRSGPWNGLRFSGMPSLNFNSIYTYNFVFNREECYYKYNLINSSVVTRLVLDPSGSIRRLVWIDMKRKWELYLTAQMDNCDRFKLCGPNGICNIDGSPPCGCLPGFKPKSQAAWDRADWYGGCVLKTELKKGEKGFLRCPDVKLPDTRQSWFNQSMSLNDCNDLCLMNQSCTAYANTDIRNGGSGCLLWFTDLIDMRQYQQGKGQDVFLKLANSELINLGAINGENKTMKKRTIAVVLIPVSAAIIIALLVILFWILVWRKRPRKGVVSGNHDISSVIETSSRPPTPIEDFELPQYEFADIVTATDNFSTFKKLGEGGFGPVYKGILPGNLEIAVKRLAKQSRQGLEEFKNELSCIAKLQHRNLVKLLGFCIHEDERLLVYEYLPNQSLDYTIFDRSKSASLDWPMRYNIINGIARGLVYLHEDSRLRVIHRDLKASNILLDKDMNPKISDFGMARIFLGHETEINTTNIVGTYGYLAPEYAIDGVYSLKSDVYSFGVLMLEIIMGRKNRGFTHPDHNHNLIGHAWCLFNEGKATELSQPVLAATMNPMEVTRCVHVGLLCVQQSPDDRPSMSSAVLMLVHGCDMTLAEPKQPGYFTERIFPIEESVPSNDYVAPTSNQLTLTLQEAR